MCCASNHVSLKALNGVCSVYLGRLRGSCRPQLPHQTDESRPEPGCSHDHAMGGVRPKQHCSYGEHIGKLTYTHTHTHTHIHTHSHSH